MPFYVLVHIRELYEKRKSLIKQAKTEENTKERKLQKIHSYSQML